MATDDSPLNILAQRGLALALGQVTPPAQGLIFQDSFDDHPDFTGDQLLVDKFDVPAGWTVGRSDSLFGPNGDYPVPGRRPTLEILASNSDKTRNGTGKSLVFWREALDSTGTGRAGFNSDALLMKTLDAPTDELYMEWYVTFSDELVAEYYLGTFGAAKMARFLYVDPASIQGDPNNYFQFFGDLNSPKFLTDISGDTAYGIRNFLALYARGDNDLRGIVQGVPSGFQLQGGGDLSLSYSAAGTAGAAAGGGAPTLTDYKNGGTISTNPVDIDQVFGDETQWVKMAMYAKMNSAAGAEDGLLMRWVDDKRVTNLTNIPWVRAGETYVLWNTVGIGGNDYFLSHSQKFTFNGSQTDVAVTFSFTDSLHVLDLTSNQVLAEGADFTVSGTTVTVLANAALNGHTLIIYDGTQMWYAVDDLKVYDGIPPGRGLV